MEEIINKLVNILTEFNKKIDSVLVFTFLNHLLALICAIMLIAVLIVK